MRYKRDIKHSTIQRYNSCYENHIKQFADYEVDEIKPALVKEWVHKLKIGPKSVRMCVSLFSQIIEEARLDEEIELLLKNSNGWFRNVLGFLFLTGMRIGECLALNWSDIQDDYIVIDKSINRNIISTTKTNNIRRVPIFKDLRPFIKNQLLESGMRDKRVFPTSSGTNAIRKKWLALLRRCGMGHRVLIPSKTYFCN